jgi:hypothetical protein
MSKMEKQVCFLINIKISIKLIQAETGVKFTEKQWKIVNRIRERLNNGPPQYVNMGRPAQAESVDPELDTDLESDMDPELDTDPGSDTDPDPKLTNELMAFCMLIIMQDTSKVGLYDSPLMHYLAIQGVDIQAKALRSAFTYTPILGRMLWMIRLIMLEIAVPLEAWPSLRLKSRAEIESIPNRIHELRQQHLCEGSYSPASSILSQLAKGKHHNQVHQSSSNIHWSDDKQTIYFQGEPVELSKVHTMCKVMTNELIELVQDLAFDISIPIIDLSCIIDSMAWSTEFRQSGFSFISHIKNQDQTNIGGFRYLFEQAVTQQKEKKKGIKWRLFKKAPNGEYEWNNSQKKAYLNQERKFLYKLMVVIQITGKYSTKEAILIVINNI